MKTFLSKATFYVIISFMFISTGFAQLGQWIGPPNSTDPIYRTGPVGINNTNPREMLEIGGRIRLGDSPGTPPAGTIRWYATNSDFEGYTGSSWKSLTSKWSASGNNILNNNSGHVQLGSTSYLGIGTTPHSKLEIYTIDPGTSWLTGVQLTAHYTTDTPLDYKTYLVQRNDGCYIRSSGYNFMDEDGISNYLHISGNGDVGINTTSPTTKLEINGNTFINSTTSSNDMFSIATTSTENMAVVNIGITQNTIGALNLGYYTTAPQGGEQLGYIVNTIQFSASNGSYLGVGSPGLAIGKTTIISGYKLDVAGKIRANEIVVNSGGADFVFDKNYDLKSLDEVEAFIMGNGHLPDMPPEKEAKEKGLSLGEMQTKLLQKIEELTLYVIEQKKQIENLKKENSELKKMLMVGR